jgi:hypothetical protein
MPRTVKLSKNDRIVVYWIDAHQDSDWLDEVDAEARPDVDAVSVGFLIKEDDEAIYLASSKIGKKKVQQDQIFIPKGMITNIRKWAEYTPSEL